MAFIIMATLCIAAYAFLLAYLINILFQKKLRWIRSISLMGGLHAARVARTYCHLPGSTATLRYLLAR
jgi:hypothetical protein